MSSKQSLVVLVGATSVALQAAYALAGTTPALLGAGSVLSAALALTLYMLSKEWDRKACRAHLLLVGVGTAVWSAFLLLGLPQVPVGYVLGAGIALGHGAVLAKHLLRPACNAPGEG